MLAGLGFLIAGCSGNSTNGTFNQPGPRIRAVNALDGVATADWQVTGQTNVNFPSVSYGQQSNTFSTPYVILNERGNQIVEFANASAPAVNVAAYPTQPQNGPPQYHNFTYGDKNTAIAYGGSGAAAGVVFLYDQTTNSTNGPNLRIVDAAQQEGSVDVFVTPSSQSQSGSPITLTAGSVFPTQGASTYAYTALNTAGGPGTFTVNFYPAGHDTGAPLVSYPLTVGGTDVWTLVLVDPATSGGSPTVLALQDNNANAG